MNCKVENGRLTIEKDGRTFSFEAHGEAPRPSLMGMGISAGGSTQVFRTLPAELCLVFNKIMLENPHTFLM